MSRKPCDPSRRDVLKTAASVGIVAAAATSAVCAEQPATAPARTFYYVDGYHGGVDGHMPADSLRNVLDGLDRFPKWKVSFEIEPYSWAVFAKSDPQSIERLRKHLADQSPTGRVEFVSGTYAEHYAWNASGECNIRQLAYGRAELRAVFPDLVVDTYAVQEPCWTSCLPQLLKSFGYRRAVLKNSTCWGGYHAPTLDADLVNWVGPDGTALPAVPRYATEELVPPATTRGAQATVDFLDRCAALSIAHPAGTTLQDMGWPGRPWRFGMRDEVVRAMRHVTWREYVETIADAPKKEWRASQEGVRVGLAWGASILQRIAQIVRRGENQILQAEKIASMANVRRGSAFPSERLDEIWRLLLWSQHHDVWIVPYNRHRGGTWATAADEKFEVIDRTCKEIVREAAEAMAATGHGFVRVFNTTGFHRRDVASIDIPAGRHWRVTDAEGRDLPCQMVTAAGDRASLLFAADVPATGYATYKAAAVDRVTAPSHAASATTKPDGTVVLATDQFSLVIDPAKGGRIRGLFCKELQREFIDPAAPRGFNEFRGCFSGQWLSSVDAPADVRIVEDGPLRITAHVTGRIGAWPFTTRVSLVTGHRRIDFRTTFDFPLDPPGGRARRPTTSATQEARLRVGEPWEPGRDVTRSNRRPFYDSSYKLQALFPTTLRRPTLYKNAPFDVCRTTTDDTRFDAWESIKNNVLLNWVDLVEEGGAAGLAVMADHVTAYHMSPGEPLGLVMGYAGPGVWFDYGLSRTPDIASSVVPHAGDWAKGRLWRELARWSEPLVTQACGKPAAEDQAWSLVDATDGGLEVTTVYRDSEHLLIRLFNAEGDERPQRVRLASNIRGLRRVELDGRVISEVPIERGPDGAGAATLTMPRFGAWTLRCTVGY